MLRRGVREGPGERCGLYDGALLCARDAAAAPPGGLLRDQML